MIFTDFKKYGVSPKHLAKLLNISRVAASNWINGHTAPHPLLDKKANAVLNAVDQAVTDGDLPPPKEFKGLERDNHILGCIARRIVKKTRP